MVSLITSILMIIVTLIAIAVIFTENLYHINKIKDSKEIEESETKKEEL